MKDENESWCYNCDKMTKKIKSSFIHQIHQKYREEVCIECGKKEIKYYAKISLKDKIINLLFPNDLLVIIPSVLMLISLLISIVLITIWIFSDNKEILIYGLKCLVLFFISKVIYHIFNSND